MQAEKTVEVNGHKSRISEAALTTAGWPIQDIIVHLEKAVTGFSEVHTQGRDSSVRLRPDSSYKKRKLTCEEE